MHDQCHRLNDLTLTFLSAFIKRSELCDDEEEDEEEEKENFGNSFYIAVGFFAYCKLSMIIIKKKHQNLTNSKVGICKTFVCECFWSCVSLMKDHPRT